MRCYGCGEMGHVSYDCPRVHQTCAFDGQDNNFAVLYHDDEKEEHQNAIRSQLEDGDDPMTENAEVSSVVVATKRQ